MKNKFQKNKKKNDSFIFFVTSLNQPKKNQFNSIGLKYTKGIIPISSRKFKSFSHMNCFRFIVFDINAQNAFPSFDFIVYNFIIG